jgi:hypothetical protein
LVSGHEQCTLHEALRRLEQLDRLPTRDQQAVLRTLDAFLAKAGAP